MVGHGAASDESQKDGFWMGSNLNNMDIKNFATVKTKYKVIAKGWVNLANPESGYVPSSSQNSIDPQIGQFHDYTVYLQPNLYTMKKAISWLWFSTRTTQAISRLIVNMK